MCSEREGLMGLIGFFKVSQAFGTCNGSFIAPDDVGESSTSSAVGHAIMPRVSAGAASSRYSEMDYAVVELSARQVAVEFCHKKLLSDFWLHRCYVNWISKSQFCLNCSRLLHLLRQLRSNFL